MNVYITYDRYEHNEWFNVYQVTNRISEVRKDYKKHLMDFIGYGPDDCHSYQIQVLQMTKQEYLCFKYIIENKSDSEEFDKLMEMVYDECIPCHYDDTNCLLSTDGCSDNVDLIDFWIEYKGLDENDRDQIEEDIYNDEDLYYKVLKKYISQTYQI